MRTSSKRLWWPRFSLKASLVFSTLCACGFAWVALRHRQYRAEQRLVETVAKRVAVGGVMTVDVNGQTTQWVGRTMM